MDNIAFDILHSCSFSLPPWALFRSSYWIPVLNNSSLLFLRLNSLTELQSQKQRELLKKNFKTGFKMCFLMKSATINYSRFSNQFTKKIIIKKITHISLECLKLKLLTICILSPEFFATYISSPRIRWSNEKQV